MAPKDFAGFLEGRGHRDDAEMGQPDRRGYGEDHGRDQARGRPEVEQHQRRDEIDEGRERLHEIEQRPHERIKPGPVGRGDAERHADNDAAKGRKAHEGDRLHGGFPVAEIGDDQERDDDKQRELPGAVKPIAKRRDGEDDDEEWNMKENRGKSVDREVDDRRDSVEKAGGVILKPRYADFGP